MALKEFARRLPRPLLDPLRFIYSQRPAARRYRRGLNERQRVAEAVAAKLGLQVIRGPFEGLRFQVVMTDTASKLVGSYEDELHDVIEELIGRQFETIVNVGCAEGYYAIGMASRCPNATVIAYDTSEHWQRVCTETAQANRVAVEVRGPCSANDLQALDARSLVIIDCEGCEDEILQPPLRATVLAELHGFEDPSLPRRVTERLAPSHDLRIVQSRPMKDSREHPELDFLDPADQSLALFERPTVMEWVLATPL